MMIRAVVVVLMVAQLTGAAAVGAELDEDAAVREALRIRLEASGGRVPLGVGEERIHTSATTGAFYEARGFEPLWLQGGSPSAAVRQLLAALHGIEAHGLDPVAYHVVAIERALAVLSATRDRSATGAAVDVELLLTDAFLLCGAHLLSGRVDARSLDPEWIAAPRASDLLPVLGRVGEGGDPARLLDGLAPAQPGYRSLVSALADLRGVEAAGGWPEIGGGPALRAGDRGPRVASLRHRLEVASDSGPGDLDAELFTSELEDAVRSFQTRHGLDPDGVVGRRTIAELDAPVRERIAQVLVNLERWRWMPEDLGRRHVRVNIAGFDLAAVEDGSTALAMRVIVGRTYRRTPVFSDRMTYLVLNPSWHVPPRLAVEDKLPEISRDPGYLDAQRFTVLNGWGADAQVVDPLTVDWSSLGRGNFPYRLRQEPGPLNALGRVKFMFPNAFDVYLHDTPARELFSRTERDFSSGCIRLERPLELAEWVLGPTPGWDRQRLDEALATGREQTVRLAEPVPVHLQYWTAWVDVEGDLQMRRDLYGRDARVAAALAAPAPTR